jgi:hypothetical protein
MALPSIYTQVYGQIPEFLKKLQEGQAPSKFTQQHLKDIGFASTNHRAFIPMLKALKFLADDGTPTTRYHDYRDGSKASEVLGDALKETYSDLFVIKANPSKSDKSLIEGKFKSTHNAKDRAAELMTKTFFALLDLAKVDHSKKVASKIPKEEKNEEAKPQPEIETEERAIPMNLNSTSPTLHYNIQIHLPATKDVEVFNAIFKSLKEHLID